MVQTRAGDTVRAGVWRRRHTPRATAAGGLGHGAAAENGGRTGRGCYGVPLVTEWLLPAQFHVTLPPGRIVTLEGL
jgi:hypothetical protein